MMIVDVIHVFCTISMIIIILYILLSGVICIFATFDVVLVILIDMTLLRVIFAHVLANFNESVCTLRLECRPCKKIKVNEWNVSLNLTLRHTCGIRQQG